MAIYDLGRDRITPLSDTSFSEAGLKERDDLQRLLRDQVEIVAPGVLVISEEFGEWTESQRRIDLLGVDRDGSLVVIELKRTKDGGHMELQAVRYAAMVSTLTVARAVEVFAAYLAKRGREDDAEQLLLDHLEWGELDDDQFGQDVRIVLVSADFSRELTTAVMWLNDKDLDIRCVRIKPYADALNEQRDRTLIDVQQIVPLPEVGDYQVQVREKRREERRSRQSNADFTRYDISVHGETHHAQWKRHGILLAVKALFEVGVAPPELAEFFKGRGRGNAFLGVDGETEDVELFRQRATEAASAAGKAFYPARWHAKQGDLMVHDGRTYAFSNQWGRHWLEHMEELAKRYPQIGLELSASGSG